MTTGTSHVARQGKVEVKHSTETASNTVAYVGVWRADRAPPDFSAVEQSNQNSRNCQDGMSTPLNAQRANKIASLVRPRARLRVLDFQLQGFRGGRLHGNRPAGAWGRSVKKLITTERSLGGSQSQRVVSAVDCRPGRSQC